MVDVVAFDPSASTNPNRTIEQLVQQLNRQGFLERSVVVPLRDRFDLGRPMDFFQRSSTTTFESHDCPYNITTDALTTVTQAKNILIAVPFVAADSFTKDKIEFEVTTGVATSKVHVGIYAATNDLSGTPYPGALVVQSIANDTSSTGVKGTSATINLTYGRLYFAAYLCGVANATVRSVPTTNMAPSLGFPVTLGASSQYGYTVASTYIASGLPTTFPYGATAITSGAFPAIFLRASGVQTLTRYIPALSLTRNGSVLRRVKAWSQAGTSISTSSYFIFSPSVRVGATTSSLGDFDTRTSKLGPGEVYYFGGPAEIDVPIAADSILEVKVVAVGWSSQTLQDVSVQFDYAFTGGF